MLTHMTQHLTPRETVIATLLIEDSDLTLKDLATKLDRSDSGIKFHLLNMMRKFGVTTRGGLIAALYRQLLHAANHDLVELRSRCRCQALPVEPEGA